MNLPSNRFVVPVLALALVALSACEGGNQTNDAGTDNMSTDTAMTGMGADTLQMAYAELQPTEGNDVHGTVTFTAAPGGVRVSASLMGLTEGQHGFHVHETGDCSAPDASSAGGHFAPGGTPHGAPTDPSDQRHSGDLGNIEADASGNASYERVDEVMTLSGPNSIIGKAVVVHADPDDLESQPSGNAGARLACGVIMQGSGPGSSMGGMPMDTAGGM